MESDSAAGSSWRQLPDVLIVKPTGEIIFPASDQQQHETTPLSGDHPFFTAVLSRTQLRDMVIPARFQRRLPARRAPAVVRCGGRSWTMNYCGDTKVKRFDTAWAHFAADNRLRFGDACVFELVSGAGGRELVFEVQVLRGGGLPEPEPEEDGAAARKPIVIGDDD